MKYQADIGFQHIHKLGIKTAKGMDEIVNRISKITGSRQSAITTIESFYKEAEDGENLIDYDKKNTNYDISMTFTGSYDADIVRKACNWISENKKYFGKEILEIGCDCGFMTTFLALIFPESHITSVDISQNGIQIAKCNVERFELNNVTFICTDVKNLNRKFDTVFSMRTMHENTKSRVHINPIDDFQIQGKLYKKTITDYAKTINSLLSENGQFISIERCERSPLFLGWLEALSDYNFFIQVNSYSELECSEIENKSVFQAFVINRDINNKKDPYESFLWCATKYMDTYLGEYKNWEARCMFEIKRKEKIKEFVLLDSNNISVLKVACWTHKYDKTNLLYLQDNSEESILSFHDISQKDEILANINETIKHAIALGYKIK